MNLNWSFETDENTVKSCYAHSLKRRNWENNSNLQQNWAKATIRLILVSLHKWILLILLKTLKIMRFLVVLQLSPNCQKSTITSRSSENATRNQRNLLKNLLIFDNYEVQTAYNAWNLKTFDGWNCFSFFAIKASNRNIEARTWDFKNDEKTMKFALWRV